MVEEAILLKDDDTILLKKAIAKNLYMENIGQSKISDILKLSQPMVSNYCSSNDKIPNNISKLAGKISERIINGQNIKLHTCISFSDKFWINSSEIGAANKFYEGNFFIARKTEIISDENINIINNLTEAFLLLSGKNIGNLLPEVKVNIAMAKEKADSPQ